jgi:hypothetical protein
MEQANFSAAAQILATMEDIIQRLKRRGNTFS